MPCEPFEISAAVPASESSPTRPRGAEHLERLLFANDPCGSEMSLVDLVLFACDESEDETEVADLVDCAIGSGAARILPTDCEPMLTRLEPVAVEAA